MWVYEKMNKSITWEWMDKKIDYVIQLISEGPL